MKAAYPDGDERWKLELYDDVVSMLKASQEAVYALIDGEATVERNVTVDRVQYDLRVSWGEDDFLCLNGTDLT
jgi:hypothetical protein